MGDGNSPALHGLHRIAATQRAAHRNGARDKMAAGMVDCGRAVVIAFGESQARASIKETG